MEMGECRMVSDEFSILLFKVFIVVLLVIAKTLASFIESIELFEKREEGEKDQRFAAGSGTRKPNTD